MTHLRFALLAAAVMAGPVAAQDTKNFNGPFIGAQAGWQRDTQTISSTDPNSVTRNRTSGFAYGGQAGYDFRLGSRAVLGGEISLTGSTGGTDFDVFNFGRVELGQGRTFNATARLGFMPDDKSLIYGRGGYANARYTSEINGSPGGQNRDGFTVGAGYERYIVRNVSARLEYGYSDFGSDSLPDLGAGSRNDYSRHAVTAGINFRF